MSNDTLKNRIIGLAAEVRKIEAQLQLNDELPDWMPNKRPDEWRAKASYALAMKRAELEGLKETLAFSTSLQLCGS